MKWEPTQIPDVLTITPPFFGDDRGFFMVSHEARSFAKAGLEYSFVQDNHSGSKEGTLRGLHYQIQHPQGKLVWAIAGEVFDVAVDIRQSSPTFGQWVGVRLSAENRQQVWVPPGFAHGFYVMSEWAEVMYKVTDIYAPEHERTILWNDPQLNIVWPTQGQTPLLSEKDKGGKFLKEAELFD
ncbi:MAG: dTDP-4-dehydrorhamnose 3,5-epimerase [Gemmataceae bacterium]